MEISKLDKELLDYTEEGMQKFADYLVEFPAEQRMGMVIMLANLYATT